MRNVFYFGRKNHYGVRLIKNVKNMCDCVSVINDWIDSRHLIYYNITYGGICL